MVAHRDSSHLQTQVGCWAWADGCPFGIQLRAQRLAVSNISSSGGSRRKRGGLSLLAFLSPGVPDLSICWICPWASIMGPPPDGSRTISVDGYQSPEGEQEQRKKKGCMAGPLSCIRTFRFCCVICFGYYVSREKQKDSPSLSRRAGPRPSMQPE